jgi:hypothetical protein
MALDADGFGHDFVKAFADECPLAGAGGRDETPLERLVKAKGVDDLAREAVERVFLKEGEERFGAYVSLQGTEYEFGKCTSSSLVYISLRCRRMLPRR